jgi:serine/threonine-protein kinase RIM15
MSPEVLSGEAASRMSDWWSFGILVFEVLTGQPPFGGQSFDEIVNQVFEKKIWPDIIKFGTEDDMISYEAKDLIEKLLATKPEDRLGQNFE